MATPPHRQTHRSASELPAPAINLPRNNIHASGHLAHRGARRKCLRNDRPLLIFAPPPAPLGAGHHFHAAHRTVLCTGAKHVACTSARTSRVIPPRARRPLSDGYFSVAYGAGLRVSEVAALKVG